MPKANGPFVLTRDNDCHWFVVPVNKLGDWEAFIESGSDDVPLWAKSVGGSPSLVQFTEYTIE